jgi:antitoxin component HigA of HigAB toxin-antitoxin module
MKINNSDELQIALKRLDEIWNYTQPDSPYFKERSELIDAIIDFENENYPITPPEDVDAIEFRLEQINYTKQDLLNLVKTVVSNLLNERDALCLQLTHAKGLVSEGYYNSEVEKLLREPEEVQDLYSKVFIARKILPEITPEQLSVMFNCSVLDILKIK